jgi:hypothetical protein
MGNTLMHREHQAFLFTPFLKILLVSVSADKAIAIHPSHQLFFPLLGPKILGPPPFKHWQILLGDIAGSTCWNGVPSTEMRASLALRDNVVNGKLFVPRAAISTCTLPERSPQEIVLKNALAKSTFCIPRAKFNERIKQLIRTIRTKHGTI